MKGGQPSHVRDNVHSQRGGDPSFSSHHKRVKVNAGGLPSKRDYLNIVLEIHEDGMRDVAGAVGLYVVDIDTHSTSQNLSWIWFLHCPHRM
jgi:hypothetical protein